MDAPRVWELARRGEVARRVEALEVIGGVQRIDRDLGERRVYGNSPGAARSRAALKPSRSSAAYSGSIGTSESVVKRSLRSARFFTAGPYDSSSQRCFAVLLNISLREETRSGLVDSLLAARTLRLADRGPSP